MQVMVACWLKFAISLLFTGPVIEQSKGHGFTINGAVTRGSLEFGGKTCSACEDIGEEILGQGEVRTWQQKQQGSTSARERLVGQATQGGELKTCRKRWNPAKTKRICLRVFIYLEIFPMEWAVPSGFLTGILGFFWQMANTPGLNYFLRMIDLNCFCQIDFRSRPCRGRSAIHGRIAVASLVQLRASWNHTLSYKKPWNAYKPTWDRKKASWIFWGRISEFIYCS